MGIVALDVREIAVADLVERALPEVESVRKHIGLAAERECLGLLPLAAILEGVPQAALHTRARVNRGLDRHFLRRALAEEPAGARVKPFGILADHDEVNVLRLPVLQRAIHAGIKLDGPKVDVLIQFEAQPQQQALLEDSGLDVRMADRAQEDGVQAAEFLQGRIGQNLAGPQIAFSAEIVLHRFVLDIVLLAGRRHDLQRFAGHFRPGTVSWDDSDLVHNAPLPLIRTPRDPSTKPGLRSRYGFRGGERGEISSTMNSDLWTRSVSPGRMDTAATRAPLTKIPFRLPRSFTSAFVGPRTISA